MLQPSDIRTLIIPDWDINPLFLGSYSNEHIGVTNETYITIRKPLGDSDFLLVGRSPVKTTQDSCMAASLVELILLRMLSQKYDVAVERVC